MYGRSPFVRVFWTLFRQVGCGHVFGPSSRPTAAGCYLQADRVTYVAPTPGGPAIALTGPISIDNAGGYIGGGGGGGAGQSGELLAILNVPAHSPGGGGAGGGRGGAMPYGNTDGTVLGSFGAGGAIGQPGSVATDSNNWAGATIASHGGAGGASGAGAIGGSGL